MSGNKNLPVRPALADRTEQHSLEMQGPSVQVSWVLAGARAGMARSQFTRWNLRWATRSPPCCLEANSTDRDSIHILALAQVEWENSGEQCLSL